MGYIGGIAQPGERQTGKRDIESEIVLTAGQGLVRVAIDVITFIALLVGGFAIGRVGVWVVVSGAVWMFKDRLADWLVGLSGNARLDYALQLLASDAAAVVYTLALLVGAMAFLPYQWGYDFSGHRHYIILLRTVTWEWYNPTAARFVVETGADNIVARFPLLIRVFMLGLPVAWMFTANLLRRRFGDEVRMVVPAVGERYSEVGLDTRTWGPHPEPEPAPPEHTVTIEKTEPTANGRKITGYGTLSHSPDVRAAFEALNSGRIPRLSRSTLIEIGIGSHVARQIMAELETEGLIEYGGQGLPAELTDYGRGLAAQVANGEF